MPCRVAGSTLWSNTNPAECYCSTALKPISGFFKALRGTVRVGGPRARFSGYRAISGLLDLHQKRLNKFPLPGRAIMGIARRASMDLFYERRWHRLENNPAPVSSVLSLYAITAIPTGPGWSGPLCDSSRKTLTEVRSEMCSLTLRVTESGETDEVTPSLSRRIMPTPEMSPESAPCLRRFLPGSLSPCADSLGRLAIACLFRTHLDPFEEDFKLSPPQLPIPLFQTPSGILVVWLPCYSHTSHLSRNSLFKKIVAEMSWTFQSSKLEMACREVDSLKSEFSLQFRAAIARSVRTTLPDARYSQMLKWTRRNLELQSGHLATLAREERVK